MEKKTALIIMYLGNVIYPFGWVGFLIALLAGKKEVVGGKNLTQGIILALCQSVGTAVAIGPLVSFVFGIIALVKIFKDDNLDPELPLIGGLNWFDK